MNKLLIFIALVNFSSIYGQLCDTNSLVIEQVRASDTDSNIPFELARHYTFYNPACSPQNVLLVHMVGSYASPYQSVLFPKLAANSGFHVLSLKYQNDVAAQSACGNSADIDCHYKFRREIIEGEDYSNEIVVDSVNSIQNRLIRLLDNMETTNPNQNWGQYFTGDSIHWNQIILSGHSQGGGHAAVMAIDRPVKRVIMFASPNDYSNNFNQIASWTNLSHTTPDSAYFSFNNINDQVVDYSWQYGAALNLGVLGDTVKVDNNSCPFSGSHNLYTAINLPGFGENHGSVVHDSSVPVDGNGDPNFKEVWSYLLGVNCSNLKVDEQEIDVDIYPNPVSSNLHVVALNRVHRYQLTSSTGAKIVEGIVDAESFDINLEVVPNGIYLLEIESSLGKHYRRIIIE